MIVTLEHLRQAKFCNRGTRLWFQGHGLDFNDFRKNGLPAEFLEQLGDQYGLKLVEIARGRQK